MKSFSNTAIAAIFALVFTAVVAGLLLIPFFSAKESQTSDEMIYLRYRLNKNTASYKPDSHLVLAAIDQASTQELGEWPFPRLVHGQFAQVLAPEKPNVVGWDIFFFEAKGAANASVPGSPDPTPATTPDSAAPPPISAGQADDDAFLQGISLIPNTVMAAKRAEDTGAARKEEIAPTKPFTHVSGNAAALITADNGLLPFPALRKISYFGFADELGDANGGVRLKVPLVLKIGGQFLPSFDFQVLLRYWGVDPDQVAIELGRQITVTKPNGSQIRIPIDESARLTIDYRARLEDFQAMSYALMGKALSDKADHKTSEETAHLPPLTDKIVIVGVTFAGVDAGATPLDYTTPLVVTHLNALNNILQQDFIRPISVWLWMPIYALLLFGIGNWMLRVGIIPMILIALASLVIFALAGFEALYLGNLLAPVAMPEIGLLMLAIAVPTRGFFGEGQEKARIKSAMSAYLSEKIMNKVLEHPDNVKLGGIKQEITIMFCDIRGFTAYCDERDPEETVEVLNDYMEAMTQVVFKYDGTIDKYIGDCIMAFWNAPQPQPDHAQRAVCCAMEMRYALANFKTKRAGLDTELFECGIGVHTGEALVGNMGSSLKRNYTAMGSTVNLAARLETLTKRLNERILISDSVLAQLQGDFPLTDRGEASIPGFAKPVHVYAVVADQDIGAALSVGRTLAEKMAYTAEEVSEPIWQPAPLPDDADPNP